MKYTNKLTGRSTELLAEEHAKQAIEVVPEVDLSLDELIDISLDYARSLGVTNDLIYKSTFMEKYRENLVELASDHGREYVKWTDQLDEEAFENESEARCEVYDMFSNQMNSEIRTYFDIHLRPYTDCIPHFNMFVQTKSGEISYYEHTIENMKAEFIESVAESATNNN